MVNKSRKAVIGTPVTRTIELPAGGVALQTYIPWELVKQTARKEVITPLDAPEAFKEEAKAEKALADASADTALIRALGLAHYWQELIDKRICTSLAEIAEKERMDLSQCSRIFQLRCLAPDIIVEILSGSVSLNLEKTIRHVMPRNWEAQRDQWTRVD